MQERRGERSWTSEREKEMQVFAVRSTVHRSARAEWTECSYNRRVRMPSAR